MVDLSVESISIKLRIPEAEERIRSLTVVYCHELLEAGYCDLKEDKPHTAIKYLLRSLKQPQRYLEKRDVIIWRKVENFEKKNFNIFVREEGSQARMI